MYIFSDMDEELFPIKIENLEGIEQLSSLVIESELDTLLEPLEERNTDTGVSSLLPEGIDRITFDSSISNNWNLIRSGQDTPTEFSDILSLKSFEHEGLDELLTLDPTDYESIFLPQDPTNSHPGSKASQHSALVHDIDIAAELLAELCKLDLDDNNPELTKPNISETETDFNTEFEIHPYCQPCQENLSSVSDLETSFTDTCLIPIVQATDPSETHFSLPMNLQHPDYEDPSHDADSVALYHSIISSFTSEIKNERVYIGHKETIFGLSFSPCGRFVATASQDSTIRIWSSSVNKCLSTLQSHNPKYECLRVAWASTLWIHHYQHWWTKNNDAVGSSLILASAGADGVVKLWYSIDDAKTWKSLSTLHHFSPEINKVETRENDDTDEEPTEEEKAQIYSIQFIDGWNPSHNPSNSKNFDCAYCILTTSDDFIHLWEPQSFELNDEMNTEQLLMSRIMSIRVTHLELGFGGVFVLFTGDDIKESPNSFHYPNVEIDQSSSSGVTTKQAYGGPRNPDNLVYVFDASYCPANGLLGVALSDGSLRLVNARGSCVFVLQLPECKARLTSFAWDSAGKRIASCVGTGQIILWSILCDKSGRTEASCSAILEGGHTMGRPLYGVRYMGFGTQVRK